MSVLRKLRRSRQNTMIHKPRKRRSRMESLERRDLLTAIVWSSGPQLPEPRTDAVALLAPNNSVHLFGGDTAIATAATETPALTATGTSWTSGQDIFTARNDLGAVRLGNDIYLMGGTGGTEGSDEVLAYDYINGDGQDVAKMNDVRYDFGYAADSSGLGYAIGGIGILEDVLDGGELWSQAERYNPALDTWTPIAPLPTPLRAMSAIGDGNGHIFVFGGTSTLDDSGIQNSILQYDVASNLWTNIAPMPVPTRDSAVVMDEDGLIYVLGGMSASGATDAVQVYDPIFNSWATQTALPEPLYSHAAVYDSLGRIMVAGGFDSTSSPTDAVYRTQRLNIPQTAPVISSTAYTDASLDTFYQYDVDATGNPAPTFSLITKPTGMTIDETSGLISWQPVAGQEGLNSVKVRASNTEGYVDQSFDITVVGDTIAPTTPADFTFDSATVDSVTLSWSPSSDASGVDRYEVFSAVYTGPRFAKRWVYTLEDTVTSTTSTISGLTPITGHRYTVQAIDTAGNRSGYATFLFATTLSFPTLTYQFGTQTSGTVSSPALHTLEMQLSSYANPTPTFSLVSGPATMSVDAVSGAVQWTPTVDDIRTHRVTFRATNSVDSTDLVVDIAILSDTPQLSVDFNPTTGGDYFAVAGTLFNAQINDASLSPSTYLLTAKPNGMTINSTTGLISWTPTGDQGGTQSVTARATNAGGTADLTFNVDTLFTGAVTNVDVTGTTLLEPTASWLAPTGEGAVLVDSYHIYGSATWGVGRTKQTHRVNYTVPASETSVLMTGLVTGKQYGLTITPIDAAGNTGLENRGTVFVSSPALPQVRWTVNGSTGGSSVPGEVIAGNPAEIVLTDQRPDPSTMELISGPAALSFSPATNTASWTPDAADVTTGYTTTNVLFRATNDVGSVDISVPVRVYFSGAVTNASTIRSGYNATASWNAPTNNATPIAGYSITRKWTWSGRPRSVTWTVGNVNSIAFPLYPTGAVSHKGITVTPLDANGNRGVSSGTLLYGAPPNNVAPVAVNDSYNATEDVTLSIDVANSVRDNDTDSDGNPLTARLLSGPANGALTLNPAGSFSYTPNQDFHGVDTFTYSVNDGTFTSNAATVTINVAAVNDAPIALFDYYAAEQEIALTIDAAAGVSANDRDVDGNPLTAVLSSGPSNGTLSLNPADGSFVYTPNQGFIGVDSFQYMANDGTANSNLATAYIAVDAPFALNDSYTTAAGVPLVVNVATTGVIYHETFDVPEAPSPLSAAGWSIVTGTNNPTVQSTDFAEEDNLNVNKITANDEADFGFTSAYAFLEHDINETIAGGLGFGETFIYTDEVVAENGGNPLDLNGAFLFVDYANGNKSNSGPFFQFAIRSGTEWFVAESGHNVGAAAQNVSTATLSPDPLDTTVAFVPIDVSPGAFNADARILYLDSLSRTLTQAELANITAVGILAAPRSDGSPARFDNFAISTTNMPPSIVAGVLNNDDDPNPDAEPLAAVLVDEPANGTVTLNPDGSFVYTPNANFIGSDSFTYQASNGTTSSNVAAAMIEVSGVVQTPAPGVESVEINDGESQHSNITSLTVTFDSLVNVPASAFSLMNLGLSSAPTSVPVTNLLVETAEINGKTIATLTFASGTSVTDRTLGNTLADGRYKLTIDAAQVTAMDGQTMAADYVFGESPADEFFRLYGDANGDGITNFADFNFFFLPAFGTSISDPTSPTYRADLDFDGDGNVNFSDFNFGFLPNFGRGR